MAWYVCRYLNTLDEDFGYKPTDAAKVNEMMLQGLDDDLLQKWQHRIANGSVYKQMVCDAFRGLIAIRALGGTFTTENPQNNGRHVRGETLCE